MLHHPLGPAAPHAEDQASSPLGAVPHQVRGFVAGFQQMLVGGVAFDKCTACSPVVINAYHDRGVPSLKSPTAPKNTKSSGQVVVAFKRL